METSKQPACHHLHPLISEVLAALKKQTNEWLESGHIVPLASPYDHPVLFTENKVRGGLCLYVDYCLGTLFFFPLNANTLTDAWPLPYIDDLLS